ncbi:hypothetical protein KL930_000224 [Ogataea haglerorum]|uniref:Uncharacterized protein n=1 Tax=Ogataea haglerorum TaxID=1937702 RepID=A0AAN6D5I9_9ASCO|nr:uncharacterized protein KL911_000907 [Ogataea haglerorum]KAG7697721.1 hypothetical protein KL951_002295 [Ogataea haglerorum]KAG7701322.1 hypothetical protein KL915_000353 [Ogataea haglerorum]KAG7706541.1 hypothetical protein KL950_003206 [Ogataea haglerorum]KAG7709280.1 hypothetical protein KL914_001670 [Ogataea haglerorum]KAG7717856.1 hypothetical protein KL913_002792 [Ogataea haglerorum]
MPPSPQLNHTQGSGGTVHPIELVVQSLIESPLEVLNLNLTSLYESQVILSSILRQLEGKLERTRENLAECQESKDNTSISLDDYVKRVTAMKSQLSAISSKMEIIEQRVDKILQNMGSE